MSSITCPNKACGAVLEGTDLRHCPKCAAFLPLPVAEEVADPLVGQPILNGKYRVLSIIGEGGMGKVYLAEQKLGHATRKVAIKTLQPDLANDPQIIARFHRETQTVIELEHPNTIKFFDFGELEDHGKKLFVVMEFIQGESLGHVLARGPIDLVRAERIMAQMCGSLQEAHDHGIVHRDLKPENIYLTQKGAKGDFVKVLDFGIAKRDEAGGEKDAKLTRQGMVLGTPPYMSPEQFTGQSLDGRSDIYALGVIAYEMLTGALPFTAATPWEWATKHLTATPTPLEQQPNGNRIPERNKKAIMRALAKNRDDRPKSVTEFLGEFTGNSEGATDWTASSTSLPTGGSSSSGASPQPIATNHGQQQQQQGQGQGGFVTNPTVASAGPFQGQPTPPPGYGMHPANTPSPFNSQQGPGGFVPAPSSAGFQAVPPGMAGSNPGFANPTGNFAPMPSQYGMAPPPKKKSSAGLIVGLVIAAAAVLGGGGFGISQLLFADDDPAPQQQQQQPNAQQMQQMQQQQQQQQMQLQQQQQQMQAGNNQQRPMPMPTPQNPAPNAPGPQPTPMPTPQNPNTAAAGGSPAVARGMSAVAGNNFSGAISALQDASRDGDSNGAARLRSEIRRRGHNRIDSLILGGNCPAAQALFRMLRGASAGPTADSFGDACPAP